jgi:hypothetical protein
MKHNRTLLIGLLGVLLVAGCGTTRSQSQQDTDAATLASAIRAADLDGNSFTLADQLLYTGGDIPNGQAFELSASSSGGTLKNGTAQFGYRVTRGQQTNTYDMLVADARLYVRPRSGGAWKATPVGLFTSLFPALRLDLLRESVLLATSVTPTGLSHLDAGFARRYTVKPAGDQLEQLMSVSATGADEQAFLKSASAEIDVFLLVPGNGLARIEMHLSAVDPASGENQTVTSSIDLHGASVSAARPPSNAMMVAPSDLLS